jgi:hypothetical protein
MNKYGWDRHTFEDVAWKSIGSARRKCTPTQIMQTSKIMHGWLPVMHMQAHIDGTADCPLCPCPDETLDHIFHCPHPVLACKREMMLEELRKKGLRLDIPRAIVDVLHSLLESYIHEGVPPSPSDPSLLTAVQAQLRIGRDMLPRGFLSTHWIRAMESMGCQQPHRKLATLIYYLWMEVTDKLWRERNALTHDSFNLNDQSNEQALVERLEWYQQNFRTVLARHDFRLVEELKSTDIVDMPPRTKRQLLYHLDIAQDAFETERLTISNTQPLITHYFAPRDTPCRDQE